MGCDKATLPFGGERMLQRVVRLMGGVVGLPNLVVVAGPNQVLPELPQAVLLARDEYECRGPLAGLARGLQTLLSRVDCVYATGCDVPLLVPAFVMRMFEQLEEFDIAVPFDGRYHHPLAAVYRTTVLPHIERLLAEGRFRQQHLFDEVSTRRVPIDLLREVDADLATLANLNHPNDYEAALLKFRP